MDAFYNKPSFTSYGTGGIEVVGGSMKTLWGTNGVHTYKQGAQNKSCNEMKAEPPEPLVHSAVRIKPRACDDCTSQSRGNHTAAHTCQRDF